MLTIKTYVVSILATLLLSAAAPAQTQLPVTGLCNTGLTPASPLPRGCRTSVLVTPVNPESGGPSVDGNWQLATPYPSAPYNAPPPNPCTLSFGPAWVDAPWPAWFNPDDGLSQWITPQADGPVDAGGWYIYRTTIPIPPLGPGHSAYLLSVAGQLIVDDYSYAIVLEDPAGSPLTCRTVSTVELSGHSAWSNFGFDALVAPNTVAYLYFVTYNIEQDYENPTGLRLEFTSASFTPK